MIARILGEGQYEIAETDLPGLNRLDTVLQTAAESGDEDTFADALRALLEAVRRLGAPVPPDRITPSDLVLPDQDTSLAQVQELLGDEGLIPG